eukprot:544149-Pyramimonas_sp.AAC.1
MKDDFGKDCEKLPDIVCKAMFHPYRRGPSMVVELKVGEKWGALVADRLPQMLDDAIQENDVKLYVTAQKMSPEERLELIPNPNVLPDDARCRGLRASRKVPIGCVGKSREGGLHYA